MMHVLAAPHIKEKKTKKKTGCHVEKTACQARHVAADELPSEHTVPNPSCCVFSLFVVNQLWRGIVVSCQVDAGVQGRRRGLAGQPRRACVTVSQDDGKVRELELKPLPPNSSNSLFFFFFFFSQ